MMATTSNESVLSSNDTNASNEPMIDISLELDQSILKRVVQPGTEDLDIQPGDYAQFYLTVIVDRSKPLRQRIRVHYIRFGKDENYPDLEIALKSMRKGEIAEFYLLDGNHSGQQLSDTTEAEDGEHKNESGSEPTESVDQVKADSKTLPGLLVQIELIGLFRDKVLKSKEDALMRFCLKEGEGSTSPKDGAEISCHLAAFLLDGTKLEERDVSFTLGEGVESDVPCGVELALQQMKLFEKSRFLIRRSLGFESIPERLAKVLPVNYEELFYEIRLNQFENPKIWELSNDERLQCARQFKDKGNRYFQQAKYELAAKLYDKVVYYIGPPEIEKLNAANQEKDQVLLAGYLNLAQTYLQLDKPFDAIKNCELALQIDAKSVKAIFRKGIAHAMCKEYDLAIELFRKVLQLDATNRVAAKELDKCLSLQRTIRERERNTFKNMFDKFAHIDHQREETARSKQKDIWKELQEESEFKTPEGDRFSDLPINMI